MSAPAPNPLLSLFVVQELDDIRDLGEAVNNVNTRARTVYYKAMYNSAASIVECFLFRLVHSLHRHDSAVLGTERKERYVSELNQVELGSKKNLYIAERYTRDRGIDEVAGKFIEMNRLCLTTKVINRNLYKRLERIREKRNEIHIQLRTSASRSYTKAQVDLVMDTALKLYDILLPLEHT
jgi:hypothetical protein